MTRMVAPPLFFLGGGEGGTSNSRIPVNKSLSCVKCSQHQHNLLFHLLHRPTNLIKGADTVKDGMQPQIQSKWGVFNLCHQKLHLPVSPMVWPLPGGMLLPGLQAGKLRWAKGLCMQPLRAVHKACHPVLGQPQQRTTAESSRPHQGKRREWVGMMSVFFFFFSRSLVVCLGTN